MKKHGRIPMLRPVGIFRENVFPWENGLGKIPTLSPIIKKINIYEGKVKKYETIWRKYEEICFREPLPKIFIPGVVAVNAALGVWIINENTFLPHLTNTSSILLGKENYGNRWLFSWQMEWFSRVSLEYVQNKLNYN